ncbi:MAG TPA: M48 family metalloprotease [Ramlibacter sp.]|uniref:M48 family metalloprotease n=1 Tax=Ramlibacter sp. TaxID=1917967 RepID=UPI002C554B24|nr:M48 family metalloprotease [Ramlibacter sp.]HVZ43208.1 M48 family metalloprotease [Ramlibacter sp.]
MHRRGFLRSACGHCLGLGAMLGLPALATEAIAPTSPLPSRFRHPAADTDEGGLWSIMDREEVRVRRSPLAIKEPALQRYLGDVACRLCVTHCPDIRVHVVRMPVFNAMMAPNGMMLVWSGLLLRVENEAQLATVMGHEMGHYLERHTVDQLRAAKDRAVLGQLAGLLGGVGGVLGQIGLLASMFAFSREHEQRADRLGMRLMKEAGYEGREAPKIWDNLLGELKITGGEDAGRRSPLFATHPPVANRRDDLLKMAGEGGGFLGEREFRAVIAPLRFGWIEDEIQRGQYEESLVLFDRLLKRDASDAEVLYARGEVYRLRDEQDDLDRGFADLLKASASPKAPAQALRSLGLVYRRRNDAGGARQSFERYLAVAPDAPDAALIRSYLAQMKS